MTYMYYLAPIALRVGGILDRDAWIFAATAVAMGATVVPAGRLADRIPRRYVMRLALALLGVAFVGLLVPASFVAILMGTLATGAGLAFMFVSFQSYVADLLRAEERSVAYGRAGALTVLATALGPALAALIFRVMGNDALALRVNAAVFGIGALVGIALTMALRGVRATAHPPHERGRWHGAVRAALPVALVYLFMGAGYGMTAPYFTVYFLDDLGMAKTAWGYLLAIGTVAGALGSWAAGALARQGAAMRVAVAGQLVLFASALVFVFPAAVVVLALAFVGRSLASMSAAPALNATLMARVVVARRAEAAGYGSLAWNAGWTAGAAVGGASLALFGGASFALGGALSLVGMLAGAALLRR